MRLTVIGCGDAFGSGGRLQSTFLLEIGDRKVLLECGATASIGLTRAGVDANAIDTILISHLHGDHFAGVVWMILSAQYLLKRTTPLRVVGPPGIAARYEIIAEALFPGMTKVERRFDLTFDEITPARPFADADLQVAAVEVSHPSGAPSYALRIEGGGHTVGFSGDTEWVDALVQVADGADLFITECCAVDRAAKFHLNWRTIEQNLPRLVARRIMLTHMNPDMLAFAPTIASDRILIAADGMRFEV